MFEDKILCRLAYVFLSKWRLTILHQKGIIIMKSIISVVFILFMVTSCDQSTEKTSTTAVDENQVKEVVIETVKVEQQERAIQEKKLEPIKWQQARVKYLNFEGGFYGLITHNGEKYLPLNLDKTFQQDGAIVNIQGKVENMMTTQQWGKPYKITNIKLIKAGRVKVPAEDI